MMRNPINGFTSVITLVDPYLASYGKVAPNFVMRLHLE